MCFPLWRFYFAVLCRFAGWLMASLIDWRPRALHLLQALPFFFPAGVFNRVVFLFVFGAIFVFNSSQLFLMSFFLYAADACFRRFSICLVVFAGAVTLVDGHVHLLHGFRILYKSSKKWWIYWFLSVKNLRQRVWCFKYFTTQFLCSLPSSATKHRNKILMKFP